MLYFHQCQTESAKRGWVEGLKQHFCFFQKVRKCNVSPIFCWPKWHRPCSPGVSLFLSLRQAEGKFCSSPSNIKEYLVRPDRMQGWRIVGLYPGRMRMCCNQPASRWPSAQHCYSQQRTLCPIPSCSRVILWVHVLSLSWNECDNQWNILVLECIDSTFTKGTYFSLKGSVDYIYSAYSLLLWAPGQSVISIHWWVEKTSKAQQEIFNSGQFVTSQLEAKHGLECNACTAGVEVEAILYPAAKNGKWKIFTYLQLFFKKLEAISIICNDSIYHFTSQFDIQTICHMN